MPWSGGIETLLLRLPLGHCSRLKSGAATNWRTSEPLTANMHVPAIICMATRLNDHFDGQIVWSAGFHQNCIGANLQMSLFSLSLRFTRETTKT